MSKVLALGVAAALALVSIALPRAEAASRRRPPPVVGRWNLTVTDAEGRSFPSWLELTFDDQGALGGRLVRRKGRPVPLTKVEWKKNELTFVDVETEGAAPVERTYRAKMRYGMLDGTATVTPGSAWTFLGNRSNHFRERGRVPWGKPVALVSKGLLGWRLRANKKGACWKESAGIISNRPGCVNIISDGRYQDFKLHAEVKLDPGAATGVFLRGRYEVQLADDAGKAVHDATSGAIHGHLVPRRNAAKPPGVWQTLDVTLVGRKVTVVLNGDKVIDGQEIPGPTGGALDSEESVPGPVMLESERGTVAFRNLVVTPALW
jgi:hypothetical protein